MRFEFNVRRLKWNIIAVVGNHGYRRNTTHVVQFVAAKKDALECESQPEGLPKYDKVAGMELVARSSIRNKVKSAR